MQEPWSATKAPPASSIGQRVTTALTNHTRFNRSIGELKPHLYATSYKTKFFDPKETEQLSSSEARLEQLHTLQASVNQTSLWFSDFNYQKAPAPVPSKETLLKDVTSGSFTLEKTMPLKQILTKNHQI